MAVMHRKDRRGKEIRKIEGNGKKANQRRKMKGKKRRGQERKGNNKEMRSTMTEVGLLMKSEKQPSGK